MLKLLYKFPFIREILLILLKLVSELINVNSSLDEAVNHEN
jgi:hypothetical protein